MINFQEFLTKKKDKYATDKPDLRNPLVIKNVTEIFKREDVKFDLFKKLVKTGSHVRAIITKNTKDKPKFFDKLINGQKSRVDLD